MDWIHTQLSALYIWLSQAPVFVQVAAGVFAALVAKSFLFLWLPSPYFAAIQSIRNSIPDLEYGLSALERRSVELEEHLSEIEGHTGKLPIIDLHLESICDSIKELEMDRRGEERVNWFGESPPQGHDND